jgi:hypothetical protein
VSRTVFLHVGIAKTGTTYLQRTLFANRELLAQHGTLYPGSDPAAHFLASLDLRGTPFKGYTYERADGAWNRLVAEANAFDGNVLISHETLAQARRNHIDRAVAAFAPADVCIVVTARDLARQIPAVWQEQLKNRATTPYDEFVSTALGNWRRDVARPRGIWGAQDIRGVVRRWAAAVGTERVVVVTVPPAGAPQSLLWDRFAAATQLPDLGYRFASGANPSLGIGEAELLRRLNPRLDIVLDWPQYEVLIKKRLAESVLGVLDTHGRLRLPQRWQPKVREIAEMQIEYLDGAGVTILGELKDLSPAFDSGEPEAASRQPEDLAADDLLETALEVIAVLAASGHDHADEHGPRLQWPLGNPRIRRVARALRDRFREAQRYVARRTAGLRRRRRSTGST